MIEEIVSVAEDCSLMFWENLKPTLRLQFETVSCITKCNELLVCGCYSGNLLTVNLKNKKVEINENTHSSLIRCIASLDHNYLGKFFVTADVSG